MQRRSRNLIPVVLAFACGAPAVAPPPPEVPSAALPAVSAPSDPVAPRSNGTTVSEAEAAVPIEADDAIWGSRSADVTIVEFSDFQCPFCSRAEQTIKQLQQDYGPARLRVVFKHMPLPFHPNAKPAAIAAATVHALGGNDAFFRFHDLAFDNQRTLSPENYEAWAKQAGVNPGAFKSAVERGDFANQVDGDMKVGSRLGVNGTPAFYINGVALSGAQPIERFKAIIEAQMQRAAELRAKGTGAERVYTDLTAANYKPPAPDKDDDEEEHEDTTTWKVPVDGSPTLGPKEALVTIVEFSDFQCPFCSRVEPALAEVRRAYGNQVRLVWKNEPLPFHPRAMPAAEWALEARAQKGDAAFWTAHDALFKLQPTLADADLENLGAQLGLDLSRAKANVAANKYKASIERDADLADDVQANGTPHFFINGRRLVGAQPVEKFKALIDTQLKAAQALVAAGTRPENVYDALMATAKGAPALPTVAIAPMAGAAVRGPAGAQVTIVEYGDFECPFCARAEATLREVLKNYPTQVKFEWHDLPLAFHTHAHVAAEAARAVRKQRGDAAFWKFHDALFADEGSAGTMPRAARLERAGLERLASEAGADRTQLASALDAHRYAADVDADAKIATEAGIQGTPAFVINGTLVNGAQPYAKFRKAVEQALSQPRKSP